MHPLPALPALLPSARATPGVVATTTFARVLAGTPLPAPAASPPPKRPAAEATPARTVAGGNAARGARAIPAHAGDPTDLPHPWVGMWVTDDGYIRHELRADGRYDEARGNRRSAYQGRYAVSGTHIDYVDDTGFTADGEFIDGVLHHAGMVLRRVPATPASEAD